MLYGLELLNPDERREAGRLIGIEEDIAPELVPTAVLAWMANLVGLKRGLDPVIVERAALECVAKHWAVEHGADIDNNDLERLLRRKMAAEATEFLAPCWRLACALVAAEKSAVDHTKLEMLEKAAQLVVPSTSVLEEHRKGWESLIQLLQDEDPKIQLEADLKVMSANPEVGRQGLRLGLVIALADGRLSADEERLCRDLGMEMGVPENEAIAIPGELNSLFWKHQNKAVGTNDPYANAILAAKHALSESGALEGLANEARDNLLEDDEEAPATGWSRLLGALSGLSQFFSARLDDESLAILSRLVYLTIMKQRADMMSRQHQAEEQQRRAQERAERERAERLAQAQAPAPAPPPAAPPVTPPSVPTPGLSDSMAKKKEAPKRSISLD